MLLQSVQLVSCMVVMPSLNDGGGRARDDGPRHQEEDASASAEEVSWRRVVHVAGGRGLRACVQVCR